jgi:8-oxo-dGTP pyrophosphatase MutT (NUDIX family)
MGIIWPVSDPNRVPHQPQSTGSDGSAPLTLRAIEIVEDRTPGSLADEGYLRIERLQVRNLYSDDSHSDTYPCDVLRRPGSDAVAAVLFERTQDNSIRVLLREAIRVPIYLRRTRKLVHADDRDHDGIIELVAGMVEASDPSGQEGLALRAQAETLEEVGLDAPLDVFQSLGRGSFASPGTGDEKVLFQVAEVDLDQANPDAASGDGSVMEEWGRLVFMELGEAIRACRDGRIPDLKTEVGLLRLADHLGYIPQLGLYASDLPEDLRARYQGLGEARD